MSIHAIQLRNELNLILHPVPQPDSVGLHIDAPINTTNTCNLYHRNLAYIAFVFHEDVTAMMPKNHFGRTSPSVIIRFTQRYNQCTSSVGHWIGWSQYFQLSHPTSETQLDRGMLRPKDGAAPTETTVRLQKRAIR
jgi:hypothetical protein